MSIAIAKFVKNIRGFLFYGSVQDGKRAIYEVVDQSLPLTDPDYEVLNQHNMIKVRVIDKGYRTNVQNNDITYVNRVLMEYKV